MLTCVPFTHIPFRNHFHCNRFTKWKHAVESGKGLIKHAASKEHQCEQSTMSIFSWVQFTTSAVWSRPALWPESILKREAFSISSLDPLPPEKSLNRWPRQLIEFTHHSVLAYPRKSSSSDSIWICHSLTHLTGCPSQKICICWLLYNSLKQRLIALTAFIATVSFWTSDLTETGSSSKRRSTVNTTFQQYVIEETTGQTSADSTYLPLMQFLDVSRVKHEM